MAHLDEDWIPATATYNYMMKDPLLDWLKYHHGTLVHKQRNYNELVDSSLRSNRSKYNFTNFIMEQGNVFENKVMKLIIKRFGKDRVIQINGQDDPRNPAKVEETFIAMKNGVPIIHGGVIHNPTNKTFGIPDLLVRNDWIKYLVESEDIKENKERSPKLNRDWHYCVVDIKFTCLLLCSNGINLLNSGSFPAYKAQLLIYNWGVGYLQGYTPDEVYILGRRWSYKSKGETYSGNSCFEKLGVIDYAGKDKEYIDKTNDALSWIRDVKSDEASNWDIFNYPLCRWELYPNMCNTHDYPWHSVKKKISDQNKDLTSLWMVGPKNRLLAFQEGVYRWSDPSCSPEILGFGENSKIARTLEEIIKINQSDIHKILPKRIIDNSYNWQNPQKIEFYVDFETVGGVVSNIKKLPFARTDTMIFMIGVGYIEPKTNKWVYRDFTADHLTSYDEEKICNEFSSFIKSKSLEYGISTPQCVHWSKAEDNMWNHAVDRHEEVSDVWDPTFWKWLDLLVIFKEEPIVINGCLTYSLKDVASAMKSHGFIKSSWNKNSNCADGQSAMIAARCAHQKAKNLGISMKDISIMKDIIQYNHIDVKVLYEIITYLRKNHINKNIGKRKRNDDNYSNKKQKN